MIKVSDYPGPIVSNIYAAPHTNFSDSNIAAATRLFALNGRIGRVRWIAYSTALWMLASVVLGLLLQLAALVSTDFMFLAGTVLTFSIWLVHLLVARRRLQDLHRAIHRPRGVEVRKVLRPLSARLYAPRGRHGSRRCSCDAALRPADRLLPARGPDGRRMQRLPGCGGRRWHADGRRA